MHKKEMQWFQARALADVEVALRLYIGVSGRDSFARACRVQRMREFKADLARVKMLGLENDSRVTCFETMFSIHEEFHK